MDRPRTLIAALTAACGLAAEPAELPAPAPRPAADKKDAPAGPAYALPKAMPIDLPTALRLAGANNPAIAVARARARAAEARLQSAYALRFPALTLGTDYVRHDGQIQRANGEVFTTSRSSTFQGGGAGLVVATADAFYAPLVAMRLVDAAAADARATFNDAELDAAVAYLDLVEVYGRIAVNADTLARAEQMLRSAKAGDEAGLNRTAADVNRAATEVYFRRQEAVELRGRAGAASARLARVLLLPPAVDLQPVEPQVLPVVLVPGESTLDDLLATALQLRPEAQAARAVASAAGVRVTLERKRPLFPQLQMEYVAGGFGGGINDDVQAYNGRGDGVARAVWRLDGLGYGYAARVRESTADRDAAAARVVEVEARVGAEVSEAAKLAAARFDTLASAQEAVKQALEMYRKLQESSFGMVGPRAQYDAIEPLLAIQQLNQARLQYLAQVVEFNKAQFRLFTAVGSPAEKAMPGKATGTEVPAVPPPPDLRPPPAAGGARKK